MSTEDENVAPQNPYTSNLQGIPDGNQTQSFPTFPGTTGENAQSATQQPPEQSYDQTPTQQPPPSYMNYQGAPAYPNQTQQQKPAISNLGIWSLSLFGGSFLMYIMALFTGVTGIIGLGANIAGMVTGSKAYKQHGDKNGRVGFWLNFSFLVLSLIGLVFLIILFVFILASIGSSGMTLEEFAENA